MWKLTIEQKRKSTASNFEVEEKVQFESENLTDLTTMIDRLSAHEGVIKTSYKIERAGEASE